MTINYLFIGGTYRGYTLLAELIKSHHPPSYAVILEQDVHEVLHYTRKIQNLVKKHKIAYIVRKKITEEDYALISNKKFDFGLCCGWRTIIKIKKIEKSFKDGILALHDSLLPKYRGFAPTNWCLINGEKSTGVTMFRMNFVEIDSGDIFMRKKVAINFNDYAIDVYKKITQATIDLCKIYFKYYQTGKKITFSKQNEKQATYLCKRIPDDGRINWHRSSDKIYNFIRALAYPYPGAFCFVNNEKYFIREATIGNDNKKKFVGIIPGRVNRITSEGVEVLCGKGTILITQWEHADSHKVINPKEEIKNISVTFM